MQCPTCKGTGDNGGNHERVWIVCTDCDGTGEIEPTIVETIKPCARCWLQPRVFCGARFWIIECTTCHKEDVMDEDRAAAIGEWNGLMSALNEAVIVAGTIDNE